MSEPDDQDRRTGQESWPHAGPYAQGPAPYGQPPYGQPPYGAPGQGPPVYYVVGRRTNGMAIASMVLGIVWVYGIGSVLALVFGLLARQQIKQRGETGEGMAIAGIVLGAVGLASVLVLVALAVTAEGF